MRILVERFGFGRDSTIGQMFVAGQHPCWTLEDEYRREKVQHETAIPYGEYPVTLRTVGGFHARYTDRFPDMHRGMLWVRDVPGFEYILIHTGNTEANTSGCILVGERGHMTETGEFTVAHSTSAYRRMYPVARDALLAGEDVTVKIIRRWEHLD